MALEAQQFKLCVERLADSDEFNVWSFLELPSKLKQGRLTHVFRLRAETVTAIFFIDLDIQVEK
ncbi:hypothetical protein A3742_08460 [Oleiphilus sp. HI0071]|nr:hypothetical protein A3737_10435 [Oleiphilus sp. HI0065]KZY78640.1 hypothetical protein A3742_22840 [Oleiphilus sp. HI0071]KZY98413.1 hypothetical protein A3744_16865 [Oleiphilus sp. HI0073]KZZ11768.1 hypothetical protein A3750_19375 [Oleiphilus sp. HI0079]KZZ16743.1 hypothetical protein A3751_02095 [Oleiphilus sp. HI0080]KZZ44894.1 hypothetical protein A3758_02820 [Oleiphilus sp. HI0118]KZZ49203.1 hypothetical protein A3760_03165 [Oleiphilus sp. HI0122]KZZ81050.1 hypothetical protein A37